MPLQQITLIKKHKGNLPLLLVCTWRQRLLFSGYFHVNSLRKNSTLLTPQNGRLVTWLQTKNYSSQLIDCYWMLSIMALNHFLAILKKLPVCQWYKRMYLWAKAPEIVKNEKLQCRTNQDSDVTYCKRCSYSGFCIGGETMDEIICEEQWLVLTKELIFKNALRTSKGRNLKELI